MAPTEDAPSPADRGIFTEADTQAGGDSDGDAGAESSGEEDEDEDEEDIVYVPPPRETAKFAMSFTERIFPTPLRESKVGASARQRVSQSLVSSLYAPLHTRVGVKSNRCAWRGVACTRTAQEEDWIAKNKVALDKRRKQLNPDARDISERDRTCPLRLPSRTAVAAVLTVGARCRVACCVVHAQLCG